MAKTQQDIAFVQLFWELLNRRTGELGKVEFQPQKAAFDFNAPIEQPFPRTTPEEQGISSEMLTHMVGELTTNNKVGLHAITVLRHGNIVYEKGFDPYRVDVWHVTYSMCKSFTGMAIGLLIDEGRLHLDDRVIDYFSNQFLLQPLTIIRYRELTVRHLLTMSSGASFNEVGAITGNDWLRSYFESSVKFEIGTKFDYNSMNTFVLSALVGEITGMSMFDYLKEKIFRPMGIEKVYWEHSPKGITKAGWGMFITQEDAAKLGQLYLQMGEWNGEQLISKEWVSEATSPQIETGKEDNPWYGYQLWMSNLPGSYMYNGMLGQNVYVYPSLDMVIVVNAGNNEVFAGGTMTKIIQKYINEDTSLSDEALPANPRAYAALNALRSATDYGSYPNLHILRGGWGRAHRRDLSIEQFLSAQNDRVYEMHSKGIGLFPLLMQVVHNNYTRGIRSLRFHRQNGIPTIQIKEGDEIHTLSIGIGKSRHSVVMMNGEEYLVGTQAQFGYNEKHEPVMTLRFAFIEEACSRALRITFQSEDRIELRWDEIPGNEIIQDTLEMITVGTGNTSPILSGLMSQINPGLIQATMQSAIHPYVHASWRRDCKELVDVEPMDSEDSEDSVHEE